MIKNIGNNATIIFISLFSVIMFAGITCICILAFLSGLKAENYLKINILIIKIK